MTKIGPVIREFVIKRRIFCSVMMVGMLVLVMKRMNLHLQLIFMQINLQIVLKILMR